MKCAKLEGSDCNPKDSSQQQHHPLILLEHCVQHPLELVWRKTSKATSESFSQRKSAVHVGLDLLGVIRQLGHHFLQQVLLDPFDVSEKHGQDATHATLDRLVEIPLEDFEHLCVVWRLDHELEHSSRVHQMRAHHRGEVQCNLALAFQEHALDVEITTTQNVRVHRLEDHVDGEPVREVPDEEAGQGKHPESIGVPGVDRALHETEKEAHHTGDMYHKLELSAADLLKHLDQQRLVANKTVDGHLFYVKDFVDVGFDVRHGRVEHPLAFFDHPIGQLALHGRWELIPHLRAPFRGQTPKNSSASLAQHGLQTREKILWIHPIDDLFYRDESANHDVACTRSEDASATRNDSLPTKARLDTLELHGIPAHLNAEPHVPDCEKD
mmetsp:Transcript_46854/g.124467  ORF Transcript_46854/g.124467 Transcript_46854/m.124467 type:complete len:383 (+) Transcript_46854:123-1271(+)